MNAAITLTTGVAAREGGSSVVQVTRAASGGHEVLVDGELYDEAAGAAAGVALEVTPARVEMRFPSGLDVFVDIYGGYLNIQTYVPLTLATTGLLGNNNGEREDDWMVSARTTTSQTLHAELCVCMFVSTKPFVFAWR